MSSKLEALTRAALNALDDGPAGFYLHVEGGAVDWAMPVRAGKRRADWVVRSFLGWLA